MRPSEVLQAVGTLVAIGMAGFSLFVHYTDDTESISLIQAESGGGEFYLSDNGVVQEVEFNLINKSSDAVVIQRIAISPGNTFPAPVFLNDAKWDGRPVRVEPNSPVIVRYLAEREFNQWNTRAFRQPTPGMPVVSEFRSAFDGVELNTADPEAMQQDLFEARLAREETYYDRLGIRQVQRNLFALGMTFDGENVEEARQLSDYEMTLTYGGPCLAYLVHTLSVCTSIAVTTDLGNTFSSDYIGFGLRSFELDELWRREDS